MLTSPYHPARSSTSICKAIAAVPGEMSQNTQQQGVQKPGCGGWSAVWPAGLQRAAPGGPGSSPTSMRPPRTAPCPGLLHTAAGCPPCLPGVFPGHQKAVALAFLSNGKNKHLLNLLLLFYFATQKWLLSTRAKNDRLSHGGYFLSGALTLCLS